MIDLVDKKIKLGMLLIATLFVIVGFTVGWLSFLVFGDIAGNCQVMFVSKEAIIKSEENRIKKALKDEPENKTAHTMFFGKINEAVKIMDKISSSYSNSKTKVLFIGSNSGSVRDGTSISAEVHALTIDNLNQNNERE